MNKRKFVIEKEKEFFNVWETGLWGIRYFIGVFANLPRAIEYILVITHDLKDGTIDKYIGC